jgi:predicted P-loop ATPase
MVDLAGLKEVVDQLWAEATHCYRVGHPWHLETPELEALAAAEQAVRFKVDEWERPIREWMKGRTDTAITEVLDALGVPSKDWDQSTRNRVQKILTDKLGLVYWRPRANGRKPRYRRAPKAEKVAN